MAQPIGTHLTVATKVRDLDSSLKFYTECSVSPKRKTGIHNLAR
jgi:hypothetical protein